MHEFYLIYLYAIPVLINQHVSLGTYGYVSHFKVECAWNILAVITLSAVSIAVFARHQRTALTY